MKSDRNQRKTMAPEGTVGSSVTHSHHARGHNVTDPAMRQ
jgi:hypothetical protein